MEQLGQPTDAVSLVALGLLFTIGITAGVVLWLRRVAEAAGTDRNVP